MRIIDELHLESLYVQPDAADLPNLLGIRVGRRLMRTLMRRTASLDEGEHGPSVDFR